MLMRTTKPLALSVIPASTAVPSPRVKSPYPICYSPLPPSTPSTQRNTALNIRGFSIKSPHHSSSSSSSSPAYAYTPTPTTSITGGGGSGILKKAPAHHSTVHAHSKAVAGTTAAGTGGAAAGKRIQFKGEATITCLSPMPEDYYGEYIRMSPEGRRWREGGESEGKAWGAGMRV
ncbi:hypothetical protein MMC09_004051 [Bachmanniomyces sp. S44760]|nr:hypothetical protein [Bachmanniomyces sp. S44760]